MATSNKSSVSLKKGDLDGGSATSSVEAGSASLKGSSGGNVLLEFGVQPGYWETGPDGKPIEARPVFAHKVGPSARAQQVAFLQVLPYALRALPPLLGATVYAVSNPNKGVEVKQVVQQNEAAKSEGEDADKGDTGNNYPDRELPRDKHGNPVADPEAEGPHSQLGQKDGRNGKYDQAREFDANGKPVRDIDFTDHGRPGSHPNPHQHDYLPNSTGGTPMRGPTRPLGE
jgi:hypothetical protein